jgi:hypothetical protein
MSRLDEAVNLTRTTVPAATAPAEEPRPSRASLAGRVLEYGILAVLPVIAFLVLRVRPVYAFDMVDPFIYTGYSQNTTDLMTRFGPTVYYWVRLGAIIPEHLSFVAFGPVTGFFVLRYLLVLLVILPLFLLLRRLHSASAGWLAVALFLTNPVMYSALGSDYPDSVIFGYLSVAFCLLFLPARTVTGRVVSVALAGVFLAACVHSQVVSVPIVGALVLGYAVALATRRDWRSLVLGLVALAAGAVLTTAGFVAVSKFWLGHGDLLNPTLVNFRKLQEPAQLLLWHSTDAVWAERVPYLAVPVVVVLSWVLLAALGGGPRPSGAELGAGVWLTVTVLAAFYLQFRGTVGILEYHLYSSSIWVPTLVLLLFVLLRAVGSAVPSGSGQPREAPKQSGRIAVLIVAMTACAWAATVGSLDSQWSVLIVTVLVGLGVTVLLVSTAATRKGWLRTLLTGSAIVGLFALTLAPTYKPEGPGISGIPIGHYDQVFGHASSLEDYAALVAASQVPAIVGPASRPGAVPQFWASETVPLLIANQVSAMYIWHNLAGGLPQEGEADAFVARARGLHPDPLVIVASNPEEAAAMVEVFAARGAVEAVQRGVIDANGLPLQMWRVTVR